MRCLLFILSLSFFLIQPLAAQDNRLANPNISALIDGIDDEGSKNDDLRLQSLSMRFDIYGQLGQGEINATLYNQGDKELEGEFEFMLPAGAVVTGYAIDLENGEKGTLIDGVLLEKEKAKRTYENQVRGQVDPGLANVSREGVFTTQIYPINPEDTRSLRVKFSFAIDGNNGLQLPIATDHKVENWDIEVSVNGVLKKPDMAIFNAVDVYRKSGKYNLTASGANEKLDGMLRISPVNAAPILISKHDNGEQFVQLSGNLPAASDRVDSSERIRLIWDKSRSRRDDNLDLEIGLAMQLIAGLNPNDIDTIYYNDSSIEIGGTNNYDELEKSLRSISYIGASSFKIIETNIIPKANICLMFTDGIETIDKGALIDVDCILHIISSSPRANDAELSAKAHKYGGSFHRLNKNSDKLGIISKILTDAPIVKSVKNSAGNTLDFVNLPATHGKYAVAAKLKNKDDTLFNIIISQQNIMHKLSSNSETNSHNGAASLWASDQLERRENDIDRKAFLEFARFYSVEASSLSFLVLEEPEDYVDADIAPPKSYPSELMEKFVEERKEADEEEAKEREDRFSQLLDDWEELKEWWEEDYDIDDISSKKTQVDNEVPPQPPLPVAAPPSPSQVSEDVSEVAEFAAEAAEAPAESADASTSEILENITVTGTRRAGPVIGIEIDAWQPDRPYLKALEGKEDDFWSIYWDRENAHGTLPAFYLDMARWLHEKGRTEEAIPVLLSALELPSSNQETMAVVASRLQRYGQINQGIELLEFLAATDSDRPQYKRLLALAI